MIRLILAGGGHAHLAVLRLLASQRPAGLDVVMVVPATHQIYSGMVPGWMAGHYRIDQCTIDLRPLAAAAGVRLEVDRVAGMDANRRCVALSDGRHLEYDLLSLDVGSEIDLSSLEAAGDLVLPVRPLSEFISLWHAVLASAVREKGFQLVVVGGGAAGVELAFAARQAMKKVNETASVTLVSAARGLLPGHSAAVVARVEDLLDKRGVNVEFGMAAGTDGGLQLASGKFLRADAVIAATGARAPCWLQLSGLALDEEGYVRVNSTHRSISHDDVFATGDVCSREDVAIGKSGVQAVRAGPVLAGNLLAWVAGASPQAYRPRRRSLYLLATGPRHAVVSWGGLSASGAWAWHWKDHIDRAFVARSQSLAP